MRFYWLLLLVPGVVMAKTENEPQLYNSGVVAYESNDFLRAAALFENATSSADRALQQQALYNLGNATYRLGETQPVQAPQLWQRALKNYETALALDPKDADAKFNRDFVKKRLEELKKQQEQQDQKQQKDRKQDQKQDGQQQQQQEQSQKQQNPQDEQSDQPQSKQSEPQEQQKQEQQQKDEQHKEQAKEQAQQEKQSQLEQQTQEKGNQPQNYEKMQAAALLDSLRENERNWNFFPEVQMKDLKDSGKPAKDW